MSTAAHCDLTRSRAELAAAPDWMAGLSARRWRSAGSRPRSEPILASHQGVTYDFPDWKHRDAAPSAAGRTDRDRAGRRHCGGVAVRTLGGGGVRSLRCQRDGQDDQQRDPVCGRLPGWASGDQSGDDLCLAAAGRTAVGRLAEELFQCESQGGQRSTDHRVAAGRTVQQVPDADQPSPGARLHAGRAGWPARWFAGRWRRSAGSLRCSGCDCLRSYLAQPRCQG